MRSRQTTHRRRNRPARRPRRGFTLAEILVASVVVLLVVAAVAGLASTVQQASSTSFATATAHQHARVAIERIESAVNGASANKAYPPFVVLSETVGANSFPDTLVVWKKDANADSNPQGNELVVFCPNPSDAHQLWELSNSTMTATVSLADSTAVKTAVDTMKASGSSTKTVLTSLIRSCGAADLVTPRAAVRFESRLRPTTTEWTQYQASTLAWNAMSWAQSIYGSQSGLRQAWVSFELQIAPDDGDQAATDGDGETLTFFGSAALYYELPK